MLRKIHEMRLSFRNTDCRIQIKGCILRIADFPNHKSEIVACDLNLGASLEGLSFQVNIRSSLPFNFGAD